MVDAHNIDVGDRLRNPSQRRGKEFEVVDVREEQTFNGTETIFAVKRVGDTKLLGKEDVIYERDHDRWEPAE